jgi:hypothetical protein
MTELRNTIYQRFMDLEPSIIDAAHVACVDQQIHSEFLTLYMGRKFKGGASVSFEHVPSFLRLFFVQYPKPAPQNVP